MKINGAQVVLDDKSLTNYLKNNNYDISKIAVELNGDIIPKRDYNNILLKEDDIMEIVNFVGGG